MNKPNEINSVSKEQQLPERMGFRVGKMSEEGPRFQCKIPVIKQEKYHEDVMYNVMTMINKIVVHMKTVIREKSQNRPHNKKKDFL